MQNVINTQCPGVVVAPLIFYSDQTSLSNYGRVTRYPLVMSIANIACENQYLDEGHVLLAILPIISSTELHMREDYKYFMNVWMLFSSL
jgi:hypothetical protein